MTKQLIDKAEYLVANKDNYRKTTTYFNGHKLDFYTYIINDYERFKEDDSFFMRGLMVIDDKEISYPLQKFFNVNENEDWVLSDDELLDDYIITDKYDGSLIIPFLLDGKLYLRTKMSVDNDQVLLATKFLKENKDLENYLHENQVFMELVSPLNRVVVDYEKTDLIKIAMNTDKGLVIFDKEPSKYSNFKTLRELREYINTIDNFEGVILQNKTNGKVYKLKTDKYIELHKTLAEVLSYKNIFELALTEKLDDVIPLIKPIKEKYDFVIDVVDLIVKKLNVILNTIEHYYSLNKENTKEYVFLLKDANIKTIEFNTLMALHKNKIKIDDINDYVKNLLLKRYNTETKVRELLEIIEENDDSLITKNTIKFKRM
ncbi:putative RNA ligase [Campylobacter phage F341]|nr:putative RNA ligase [Campylobacter phage F341]